MESRNVVLGLLAVLIAVGSAIASINLVSKTPGAKYRNLAGITKCVQTSGACNDPNAIKCKISIAATNRAAATYQAFEFIATDPPTCGPLLTHTSGGVVGGVIILENVQTIYNPLLP